MKENYEVLADGLEFPEGPISMADGSVLVVELAGQRLTRVLPRGGKEVVAKIAGGPNGAAIGPDGAVYICNNGGIKWEKRVGIGLIPVGIGDDYCGGSIDRVCLETGKVEKLYLRSESGPLFGPNDIVFDSYGGFYFTDLGKIRDSTMDVGSVYYATINGNEIRRIITPILGPNGVGLSPDGKVLYVAETRTCRLWGFNITGPGALKLDARWPSSPHGGHFLSTLTGYYGFDSLAIEEDGNICVGTIYSRGGISTFSPGGSLIDQENTDDPYTSNICFGGVDMRTAFVTLSASGRLVRYYWPRPGLRLLHQS